MPAGVTIDKTDITSVKNSMAAIKAGAPDAIRFATNNVLAALKTAASKAIRAKVTAKAKAVNATLTIKKMFVSDMSANLTCTGEPVALVDYYHTKTVKGIKVMVEKNGTPKVVKHSFKATMNSGHTGIFWREDRRRGVGSKRFPIGKYAKPAPPTGFRSGEMKSLGISTFQLPIHELWGPRIPDVMNDDDVMGPILQEASDRYDDRLKYHIDRLLDMARSA